MVGHKITDEELQQELLAGLTVPAIAEKYGMNRRTVTERKRLLNKRGFAPDHGRNETLAPEGYFVKGVSQFRDGDGNVLREWVKTEIEKEKEYNALKDSISALVEDLPQLEPNSYTTGNYEDLMAVYPLGDPHIGMLAWGEESGEDWDLAIAEKVFINIFDRVVKTAPRCKYGVIVNLGDYFHRDNAEGVTSRSGHHLECDGRFAKMVRVGLKIMRRMIESSLEHHEIVEVWNIPGNHDDVSSLFLAAALKHIYEKDKRVVINDNPNVFQYKVFGKNLIGAHHGHTCKMDKLPSVMAADKSKEWGETEFRYWLTGHIHHDSKKELPGCIVESFRTLASKDVYANSGGWRSGRDQKVIVYHKDMGEIERHTVNINGLL